LRFHHPEHPPARFWKSRWLPAPFHLVPVLGGLKYLTAKQGIEISRATWALMRTSSESLRRTTAMQWLTDHGQSAATIRDYWEVVLASALGESCERVSMAAARKVFIDGFLACKDASDVLVPRRPLATLFGETLSTAISHRGATIKIGTRIDAVQMTATDQWKVAYGSVTETFDHTIVAVPWFAIAKVISPATASRAGIDVEKISAVASSPITGIHLWFDREVMKQPHAVLVGTLSQWVFRRENGLDSSSENYVQVVISASHDLRKRPANEIIDFVVEELRHEFPLAKNARLIRARVVTDPNSVFSLTPQVDAMRPHASTNLPTLHLAGDFVQTGWPSTMEGAVISGRMAAASVLGHPGSLTQLVTPSLSRSPLSRLFLRGRD